VRHELLEAALNLVELGEELYTACRDHLANLPVAELTEKLGAGFAFDEVPQEAWRRLMTCSPSSRADCTAVSPPSPIVIGGNIHD